MAIAKGMTFLPCGCKQGYERCFDCRPGAKAMTIEKEYPDPPTPREIKFLAEIQRIRDLADSMGQDNIKYLQEIERLQARIVTLEGMLGEANIEVPE